MARWVVAAAAGAGAYVVLHLAFYLTRPETAAETPLWQPIVEVVGSIIVTALLATRTGLVPQQAGTTLATATAIAARRETHEALRDMRLLFEIAQGVSSTIELPELLERITALVRTNLTLREFVVLLFDPEHQFLQVRAAFGFADDQRLQNMIFHVGEGVSGEVARSGKMLYVRDTRKEPRFLYYRGELQADGALVSIPLWYKNEVLGVVNFGRAGVGSFPQKEIRLLNLIANQVALAIANARLYMQTRELAVRDELTGLYNRRHFQEVLQIEWKRAVRFHRALSVLMIDVDHFKAYNDTFGHLHGDQVLRHLSEVLRRNLREVDTVARFGGEEFIVLLPDTDRAGALHVGEKLRRLIELERFPVPQEGAVRPLTISAGLAVHPDDAQHIEDLIDHADIALYEAKDTGRNRVVAYPARSDAPTSATETRGPRLVS
ncbi:MAG: GGDEF domain-containing protein [Deltaproteobacteria bacterium]|nr:GGDEF domain-containing protein [Deltaproteobacteria bacterium]